MTNGLNILVAEDDAIIGILLAELLAEMGHRVCAVEATVVGAINAAARFKPDLAIVDEMLGEGSGIMAVEAILLSGPIAHIFVSGNASEIRGRHRDAIRLQKPFSEAQLAAAITLAVRPYSPRAA